MSDVNITYYESTAAAIQVVNLIVEKQSLLDALAEERSRNRETRGKLRRELREQRAKTQKFQRDAKRAWNEWNDTYNRYEEATDNVTSLEMKLEGALVLVQFLEVSLDLHLISCSLPNKYDY
jgi:chromosome segregation ATPase